MSPRPEEPSHQDEKRIITFGDQQIDLQDPHWLDNAKYIIQGASAYVDAKTNSEDIARLLADEGVTVDDIHAMQNTVTKTFRKKLDGTQQTLELLTSISAAMQTERFERPPESYMKSAGVYRSTPHSPKPGLQHKPEGYNPEDR
jgi:hypothetical protein